MPVATRAVALQEAVKATGVGTDLEIVMQVAEQFHQFIMADEAKPVDTAAPAKPAKAPKGELKKPAESEEEVVAKAQAKARAKVAAEEAAEDEAPEVSKQDVANVVTALLKANLRTEAVDLFKAYGATSVGTLPEAKYASYVAAAKAMLEKTDNLID